MFHTCKFCNNVCAKGRRVCSACRARRYKERHPINNAYIRLKSHAKGRGIPFNLSKERFTVVCLETNYHLLKGQGPEDPTAERPDPLRGYEDDNFEIITHAANSVKGMVSDRKLVQKARGWGSLVFKRPDFDDVPF